MSKDFLFTSESVSEGHPDKVADQISDAVLDAILAQDPASRVACETLVKTGMVLVAGEISTNVWVDIEAIVRKVVVDIGYNTSDLGFDGHSCAVLNAIGKQSPDIAHGVDGAGSDHLGAGDQGMMFGFATRETESLMPAPIHYAHQLMKRQASLRKLSSIPWLRPDAKAQVTLRYINGKPSSVDTVVISTQHDPGLPIQTIREAVIEEMIYPTLPREWLKEHTKYIINPAGDFVLGGPLADCGLTGRKIIVDTYGGFARHGGGAFSGKDPSKVDRSGAYMARYIAKNIVAAGLAEKCEVQISYAIGQADPVSVMVDTFQTGVVSDQTIVQKIHDVFDMKPRAMIQHLNLLAPQYQKTVNYGHFGREDQDFAWEKTDQKNALSLESDGTYA